LVTGGALVTNRSLRSCRTLRTDVPNRTLITGRTLVASRSLGPLGTHGIHDLLPGPPRFVVEVSVRGVQVVIVIIAKAIRR
jgi:hypothetical protein